MRGPNIYAKELRICDWCGKKSTEIHIYKTKNNQYFCENCRGQYKRHKDKRKNVFDPQDYIMFENYAYIVIRNKKGEIKCYAIIDIDDVEKCKKYRWGSTSSGYAKTVKNGRQYQLHKYIFDEKNEYDQFLIDHKNRNPLDNRKSNLRFCTHAQNSQNLSIAKNNKTGVTGIKYNKKNNNWSAYIKCNGENIYLGTFDNKENATQARKKAEKELFKEFAPE